MNIALLSTTGREGLIISGVLGINVWDGGGVCVDGCGGETGISEDESAGGGWLGGWCQLAGWRVGLHAGA